MTYPLSDSFCMKFKIPRPPSPYSTGQRLAVRSHCPPPLTVGRCALNRSTSYERESKHPLDRCLFHQPLPGSDGTYILHLRIAEAVKLGDKQNAQLAMVQVLEVTPNTPHGPLTNLTLLAKFYDPLYYDHDQDDVDPFLCVDRDYSHETAAYTALAKLQGKVIPKYYGSYSLELSVNKTTKRFVRLILMELVPGSSMQQLDPVNSSQRERQTIVKSVVDIESLIYTHNVFHRDVFPRNILILDRNARSRYGKVVIIDLASSDIGRSRFPEIPAEEDKFLPGVPISPLLRWNEARWPDPQTRFGTWVDWAWQPWLEHHYGSTRASITDEMRSIWLPFSFTSPPPEPPGFS